MATATKLDHSTNSNRSRTLTSICLSILILAIIVVAVYIAHRVRPKIPLNAAIQRSRRQNKRQTNGIGGYILESLPIFTYSERQKFKKQDHVVTFQESVLDIDPTIKRYQPTGSKMPRSRIVQIVRASRHDQYHKEDAANSHITIMPSIQETLNSDALPNQESLRSSNGLSGCSICTEDFIGSDEVRILPCDHIYHQRCIDLWLSNLATTCPVW